MGGLEHAKTCLLARIKEVVEKEGTSHILRKGFDIHGGGHFDLCYFPPANPAAEESIRLSGENIFQVYRQLRFSEDDGKSLDIAIFLNGLPIFTAELKNQQTGQDVGHAMRQYRDTRNPKEPLFRFKRCLSHFAVDNSQVYMTTEIAGPKTDFLPFNKGDNGGSGNPPSATGYASGYLWGEVWKRESILDLVRRFVHIADVLDDKGKKTGRHRQIFPRYHQMTSVRELCAAARKNGAGKRYLLQHSAGSGKTNCIAWAANSLATLHDESGRHVFSTVIVVSDRRVIDRQLQRALSQVVETRGMLVNIDSSEGMTSRDLSTALKDGKRIVVTTLQKFGELLDSVEGLPGENFAVIIDEAHSSQTGEHARALRKILSSRRETASIASDDEDSPEDSVEDLVLQELNSRDSQKNVSYVAFTATPKSSTLQMFGCKTADGSYRPFNLYSMRQAIEEGFILDVLKNYATYDQYWSLLKKVEDDPEFSSPKAKSLLKQFVSRNKTTISKKSAIMLDHFTDNVAHLMGGRAKGMVVTSSRLHAVRYKLAIDELIKQEGLPFKTLVAFTDTVTDPETCKEYTEAKMNGFAESATADRFESNEYRIIIVASKFQTGFDQPKLVSLYCDKKLRGVAAVQTLSRLNRIASGKEETFVLDFENSAEEIESSFQPFYDRVALTKEVSPNELYNIRTALQKYGIHEDADIDSFASCWFGKKDNLPKLHATADPVALRWFAAPEEDRVDYKSKARDFVKLYSFVSGLVPIKDTSLEKLFVFLRFLIPKMPTKTGSLPHEVMSMVDMEKLAIRRGEKKDISLKKGESSTEALNYGAGATVSEDDQEALSEIIKDINQQFNTEFAEDEALILQTINSRLDEDIALQQQLVNGARHAVSATFMQVAKDALEEVSERKFRFYKRVCDDPDISARLFERLLEWYVSSRMGGRSTSKRPRKR